MRHGSLRSRALALIVCAALAIPAAMPSVGMAEENTTASAVKHAPPTPLISAEGFGTEVADDGIPGIALPASPVNGTLSATSDPNDYFAITLTKGSEVTFTLNGQSGTDFDMYFYDGSVQQLSSSTDFYYPDSITWTAEYTGTHFLRLYASSGSGTYSLNWSVVAPPDLKPTALTMTTPVATNGFVNVSLTLRNLGGMQTEPFEIAYYLSPDPAISSDDLWIGGASDITLGAGQTSTRTDQVSIPSMAGGTYYVAAVVDSSNSVLEGDESNNGIVGNPVVVRDPAPSYAQLVLNLPLHPSWGQTTQFPFQYAQDTGYRGGKSLVLQFRKQGTTTWRDVAWSVTDPSGNGVFFVKPSAKGLYRARISFYGNWVYSADVYVSPAPVLTVRSATSVSKGKKFTVSGYLAPRHTKGAKTVTIKCYLNGHLRKTVKAKNYNKTVGGQKMTYYKTSVSLPKPGRWTLKAEVKSDISHIGYTTPGRTVYVGKTRMSARNSGAWSTYRSGVTVSGYLRGPSGKGISRSTVRLQKWDGGWKTIKKVRTNSKGRAAAKVKPRDGAYYRFYYPGSSSRMKSTSSDTYVNSCYHLWDGYSSYTNGYWINTTWLTKGKHKVRVWSSYGLDSAYVVRSDEGWGRQLNKKHISSGKWYTYYITVPSSAYYRFGWRGNWSSYNQLKYSVW